MLQKYKDFLSFKMLELKSALDMGKKGFAGGGVVNAKIAGLFGALIVIVILVQLAPTMFNGSNNITSAPSWLGTVLPVIIAGGLVFVVWRAFGE